MKRLNFILLLAGLMLVFTGCKDDESDDPSSLIVSLTANYDLKSTTTYEEVNIEILQISYHTSDDATANDGWVDVPTTAGIYDLMLYDNDEVLLALDAVSEPQTISQLRLLLGENNTVVEDGETHELVTPSGQTSGIKVQVHLGMEPGVTYDILLNFDPEESVKKIGNGTYKLEPVIDAIVNVVE